MSMHVNINVVEETSVITGTSHWAVEVLVDGRLHDRIEAETREEAHAIHADLLTMAQQEGGLLQ